MLPWSAGNTSMVGSCLTTMVSTRPKANPRSTGLAIRLARAPKRARPAATNMPPASSTRPTLSANRADRSLPATETAAANKTAADEDVAETMAYRLLPNSP